MEGDKGEFDVLSLVTSDQSVPVTYGWKAKWFIKLYAIWVPKQLGLSLFILSLSKLASILFTNPAIFNAAPTE